MSTTQELPAAWKPFAKDLVPPPEAPAVSSEQLDLVKRTVASGATADELKLYLYDCQRQGVHPLDKLIHFTKRGGKYTPITSIDFMRTRAADTNEYAGSDDALFADGGVWSSAHSTQQPVAAMVSVYRLVQGHVCKFTATARWSEYCPASGQDHMWKKMPHTMLAKCAEALALRKGFPRQLAGLYAKEEMDQADSPRGYVVEAPSVSARSQAVPSAPVDPPSAARVPADQGATPAPTPIIDASYATTSNLQPADELPDGSVLIRRVDTHPTKNKNVTRYLVVFSNGEELSTINEQLGSLCQQVCQELAPVTYDVEQNGKYRNLVAVHRVTTSEPDDDLESYKERVDDGDVPF